MPMLSLAAALVDFTDPTTVGISLMVLGVIMFLVEATVPGFFIGVPATIMLILGVVAYNTPAESFDVFLRFAPLVVVVVAVPATAASIWVYRRIAPPSQMPTTRSSDSLLGAIATVTRTVEPESAKGKIRLGREVWSATTDAAPIPVGAKVRISAVEGVILHVTPAEETTESR